MHTFILFARRGFLGNVKFFCESKISRIVTIISSKESMKNQGLLRFKNQF